MKLIKTWMSESMPGVTGACKAVIGIVCSRSSRVEKEGVRKRYGYWATKIAGVRVLCG